MFPRLIIQRTLKMICKKLNKIIFNLKLDNVNVIFHKEKLLINMKIIELKNKLNLFRRKEILNYYNKNNKT